MNAIALTTKTLCLALGLACAVTWGSGTQLTSSEQWAEAARAGDVHAMLRLGWYYQRHVPDLDQALLWFRRAAEAGSVEAQYHLAQSYMNGALGTVDAVQSEYWYGRVREQGLCPSVIRPVGEAGQ